MQMIVQVHLPGCTSAQQKTPKPGHTSAGLPTWPQICTVRQCTRPLRGCPPPRTGNRCAAARPGGAPAEGGLPIAAPSDTVLPQPGTWQGKSDCLLEQQLRTQTSVCASRAPTCTCSTLLLHGATPIKLAFSGTVLALPYAAWHPAAGLQAAAGIRQAPAGQQLRNGLREIDLDLERTQSLVLHSLVHPAQHT